MKDSLKPGLTHTFTYEVPAERTVPHLLPESPDFVAMPHVFATGYMVAVIEWACIDALREHLDEGEITVGAHVDLSHSAPTVPGSTVTIDLKLTEIDSRILTFDVKARDEYAVISEGTHRRGLVNREKFEGRLADR